MPLKTLEMEEPALNLTPMIDIVLLLVIFFMVGTQFAEDEGQYEIVLPTVSEAQPLTSLPDDIVISVTHDGGLIFDGEEMSLQDVEAELRAAKSRYAGQAVVIRGDGAGPYQHVMTILNLCQRTQIKNVQLANREEDGGP
ncbi:biopolymer transport protein ExbD [Thalassoglobus neptunius]|uniref:Biopolymer transport protein ExbD n=1 Tax=Thalassoglobus neptunius TaxID=1938619 RepID=A0A5C5X759_9PLAN|nr:biopolymer transporter ExbD [Thalassoglobus neptunius]TWT58093.1 biopolymer transport protein ExbD [Thalassoglobus neptunius]